MQRTNESPSPGRRHKRDAYDARSFRRRVEAAGLNDGKLPDDRDEFRDRLTRRIYMFLNYWHGCPELLCRRNRGCMAPNIVCANVEQPSEEELARDWPRVQAEVRKAFDAHFAAHGREDK